MSEFIANCEHCEGQVSYPPEAEGTTVECPHCARPFTLHNTAKSEQVFWSAAPPQDPLAPVTPQAPELDPLPPELPEEPAPAPSEPPAASPPLATPDDLPPDPRLQQLPDWLKQLQQHKRWLFALAGFVGGVAGSVFSEFNPLAARSDNALHLVVHTAVWTAMFAGPIAYALFWANSIYFRRRFAMNAQLRAISCGVLSGALSGAIAQSVYGIPVESVILKEVVLKVFCWGLMGMLLALGLTRAIPNLKARHGALGGFGGGMVGGAAFLVATIAILMAFVLVLGAEIKESERLFRIVEAGGRSIGIGLLGAALGLSIVIVESIFREASVEILWGPHENTFLNLGAKPVTIGGGPEDDVYIRGLGPDHARIEFTEGQVLYVETASGNCTPLKEGSRLEIGALSLVIHAEG